MSLRLLSKFRKSAQELSGLSPGARFVLLLYCECADNNSLEAYPGTPMLMSLTGHGERQVQRYVQELRTRGFLELVKNRGGRRQYATYRVTLGVPIVDPTAIPQEAREALAQQGLA